jgi:hypothetical protein
MIFEAKIEPAKYQQQLKWIPKGAKVSHGAFISIPCGTGPKNVAKRDSPLLRIRKKSKFYKQLKKQNNNRQET